MVRPVPNDPVAGLTPSDPRRSSLRLPYPQFVIPMRERVAETNGLLRTAQALKGLRPSIEQFFVQEKHAQDEEEMARGKAAFLENRKQYGEAVRKGLIDEADNPHFLRGYLSMQAKQMVTKAGLQMNAAYADPETGPGPDASAAEVSQWVNEWSTNWLKENGGGDFDEILQAELLIPGLAAAENNLLSHHGSVQRDHVKKQSYLMLRDEIQRTIEDVGGGAEALQAVVDSAIQERGMDPRKVNATVTEAIAELAIRNGDPGLVDVLDEVWTGSGSLGKIRRVQAAKEAARRQAQDASVEQDFQALLAAQEAEEAELDAETLLQELREGNADRGFFGTLASIIPNVNDHYSELQAAITSGENVTSKAKQLYESGHLDTDEYDRILTLQIAANAWTDGPLRRVASEVRRIVNAYVKADPGNPDEAADTAQQWRTDVFLFGLTGGADGGEATPAEVRQYIKANPLEMDSPPQQKQPSQQQGQQKSPSSEQEQVLEERKELMAEAIKLGATDEELEAVGFSVEEIDQWREEIENDGSEK